MTEKEIHKYINRLNNGNFKESIFIRRIGENVDLAKVWSKQPKLTDNVVGNFDSYRFFFIKDEQGKYVCGVYDMGNDLHWYVLPIDRKKGYLTKALEMVIIPYLFEEQEIVKITIHQGSIGKMHYENSLKVAQRLGFQESSTERDTFILTKEHFDWSNEGISERDNPISEERMNELKRRAFFAYKTLYKINDELDMAYLGSYELADILKQLKMCTVYIEDLFWDGQKD